jgi:proteasome lid subunit RPN8/RPN11
VIRIFFFPDSTRYVLFTEQALTHMYAHTQRWPWQKEAGGEIYAAAPDAAGLAITAATGPNPHDRRSRYSWNPDIRSADMDRQNQFALGRHAVGLWHTHPEPMPTPSGQDRQTTSEYLEAFQGDRGRYLMVVIGNRGTPPAMSVWVSSQVDRLRWLELRESSTTKDNTTLTTPPRAQT